MRFSVLVIYFPFFFISTYFCHSNGFGNTTATEGNHWQRFIFFIVEEILFLLLFFYLKILTTLHIRKRGLLLALFFSQLILHTFLICLLAYVVLLHLIYIISFVEFALDMGMLLPALIRKFCNAKSQNLLSEEIKHLLKNIFLLNKFH